MLTRLPVGVQKWIVGRAGGKDQHVGFIVEPYSLFLAYEIRDEAAASRLLPPGYELVPTAIFEGTEPRLCGVIGAFNVHTSVFWGTRVELSLIAENTDDRHAVLGHLRLRVEHHQLRPRPGVLGSSTTSFRGHDELIRAT